MARELQIKAYLNFKKAATQSGPLDFSKILDVTGTGFVQGAQSIGTSDVTIGLGSISTIGYLMLYNTDATNYVTVGSDGTLYPIKLKPGEFALVRWNAAALHAKANTAACVLEFAIIAV